MLSGRSPAAPVSSGAITGRVWLSPEATACISNVAPSGATQGGIVTGQG